MRRRLLFTVVALLFALIAITPAFDQRVSFRTDDGVTISGVWHEPYYRPAPAVILVHMLGRSRRDWEPFASRLASGGIGALTFDLRGHGDSTYFGGGSGAPDYSVLVQDLRAARRYLASRADVLPTRIGIAGASIGANLAVLEAAAEASIASVALLSPSLDYRGLRIEAAARKIGSRPMLLVASDDDPYAMRSALELQKGGNQRELLQLHGAGHGTRMLTRADELGDALMGWFKRTLQ